MSSVTSALIAANVAGFLLQLAMPGIVDPLALWPLGAAAASGGEVSFAPWQLVTYAFLHGNLLHIGFNMLALWVIGKDFERVVGRGRFLAVYLVGLLGGSASAFVFGVPRAEVAGASGAVFGLMGGLAVLLRRLNLPPGPAVSMIVINLVISFVVPGISVLGHLGGLVVGAVATAAMVYAPARRRVTWQSATIAMLVVLLVLVMAARAVTFVV
jgi:membrane associated rhomboid family serine protease